MFAVALARLPGQVRSLNSRAAHNASLPAAERDLELADDLGLARSFLLEARRVVPERAAYTIEIGKAASPSTPLGRSALPSYAQNFLFPRLQTTNRPSWLLCYGCDRRVWKGRIDVVWNSGDLAVARITS